MYIQSQGRHFSPTDSNSPADEVTCLWFVTGICNPLCANGGTCIGPDRCECPSNFSGTRCGEYQLAEKQILVWELYVCLCVRLLVCIYSFDSNNNNKKKCRYVGGIQSRFFFSRKFKKNDLDYVSILCVFFSSVYLKLANEWMDEERNERTHTGCLLSFLVDAWNVLH